MRAKLAYFYLLAATGAWGSLYVAGKYVLDVVPPFTLLCLRYLVALTVLLILWRKTKAKPIAKEHYPHIFAIGFLGYYAGIGTQLVGNKLCDASVASLINAINPVIIALLAIVILKERVSLSKALGIALTIVGAAVIIGHIEGNGAFLGGVFSLISVFFWSLASVLVRKISPYYDSLTITVTGFMVALVFGLPTAAWELMHEGINIELFTAGHLAAILYIGYICTAMALLFWNRALGMLDATMCSLFYPIQPITSTLLGILLLGEVLTSNFLIGGALIICGIVYSIIAENHDKDKNVTA